MKVRSILLAVALSCGLVTMAQASKKVVVPPKFKAAATARKNAKKQAKSRSKVVHKASKSKSVHKPVKH
jgi:hypothetical protein